MLATLPNVAVLGYVLGRPLGLNSLDITESFKFTAARDIVVLVVNQSENRDRAAWLLGTFGRAPTLATSNIVSRV